MRGRVKLNNLLKETGKTLSDKPYHDILFRFYLFSVYTVNSQIVWHKIIGVGEGVLKCVS